MKLLRNYFLLLGLMSAITACTYSINMVHTQGEASDVVDETQTPSTTANPNISIPMSAIP